MERWKESDVLEYVNQLANICVNQRDLKILPSFTKEPISFVGKDRDECNKKYLQASALEADKTGLGYVAAADTQFRLIPLSDTVCVVCGTFKADFNEDTLPQSVQSLRLSAVIKQTGEGLQLIHIHVSHAESEEEPGGQVVAAQDTQNPQTLRAALYAREHQLANLTKHIPGGVHQCANEPELSLLSMSDGFLNMFGYTKNDIASLFDSKFINMIHPCDRSEVTINLEKQLESGQEIELEYRVLCKDGTSVWVLDKGRLMDDGNGDVCLYCLLVEITDKKHQQEDLRLSLERYQVIMDQATDIIFEWDIHRDTLTFSSNWFKKFGYEAIDSHISEQIPLSKNIHPSDMPTFLKIMKDTAAGVPFSETEFRIRNKCGVFFWCRIRATTQYDSSSRPIKAVGVIVDIDSEKKQKQALLEQAQCDALTGLYNKATVNARVEQMMLNRGLSGYQALLIIDVDHFKAVNDNYGHLCGDSVLSDLAVLLKNCTRHTDLVGRIGGDEFLVYLPEIKDEASVRQKAVSLLDSLKYIIPEKGAAPISCSIGAAVFPRNGIDYYALYKCADQALYQMKKSGRRGVSFFGSDTNPEEIPCGLSASAVGDMIVSDESNVNDEGLAQYAFRTLYRASDTEFTINRLLEIVGRSFDVSRVYIFESSEDGQHCSNTFEWCNENISRQMDRLQNIAYVDELGDYLRNFDANGTFYCHDIENLHPDVYAVLAPQGIRSMLQCAMLDEGEFVGYVGFDECRENRSWTSRQVDSFKLTANVLSTFLIKLRQKQKLCTLWIDK